MMRSLYSGVSGLNNHQIKMDVIGNNISNVNTTGFKKGRVTFQDILSQTMSGPSKPEEIKGGVNPKQVGLGMTVAAIDTIHTQGSLQTTGVNTDIAILGDGFFIEKVGNQTLYSRNGAFSLDAETYLVNPATGYRVQGYGSIEAADGTRIINKQDAISDIRIPYGEKDPAKATLNVRYRCNLNVDTPAIIDPATATAKELIEGTWSDTINVYDSRGNIQKLQIDFRKFIAPDAAGNPAALENVWQATVNVRDLGERGIQILGADGAPLPPDTGLPFVVAFNEDGSLRNIFPGTANPTDVYGVIPAAADNTALVIPLQYQAAGSEQMNVTLNLGEAGSYTDTVTQQAELSTTKAFEQDGYVLGYLKSYTIDDSGVIIGVYDNNNRKELGQIALATFANPGGLEKAGDSYYTESANSGMAMVNGAGEQTAGKVRAGTLEMSNVDLANEFTDMITTQRGFQANSRTITTSDTMLEEVLRLKR